MEATERREWRELLAELGEARGVLIDLRQVMGCLYGASQSPTLSTIAAALAHAQALARKLLGER